MAKTHYLFRLLSGSFTEKSKTYRAVPGGECPKVVSDRRLHEIFTNQFELIDDKYPHAEFKVKMRKPKGPINVAKAAKEKAAAKKAEEAESGDSAKDKKKPGLLDKLTGRGDK